MTCPNHARAVDGLHRCARCQAIYCADCLVAMQGRLFCAACKAEELLDARSGVVHTHLRHGRFLTRLAAFLIDGLIVGVMVFALTGALGEIVEEKVPVRAGRFLLTPLTAWGPFLLVPLLYEAGTLSMTKGQTVGKNLLGLRVVRPDGSRITAGQAWGRAGIRQVFVLGCTLVAAADYIPFFFTAEKTTLHDMIARTRVVESR